MSDEPKPLTDEELAWIEARVRADQDGDERGLDSLPFEALLLLVAEVRRLRSDEWLRAALKEIREGKGPPPVSLEAMLAVFRKHRDKP